MLNFGTAFNTQNHVDLLEIVFWGAIFVGMVISEIKKSDSSYKTGANQSSYLI